MGLFGRRKKRKEYDIIEFDMKEILSEKSNTDINARMFDKASRIQYIRMQCEQVIESSNYIEEAKKEYASVTEYLSDIQKIENLPEEPRQVISEVAEDMFSLNHERVESRNKKSRLPASKYDYYLAHEGELSAAIKKMQNDEQYFQMIKKDLNMLEAEKVALNEDIERSVMQQGNIKNLSIMVLVVIILVFALLAAMGKISPTGDNYIITVILFIMTLIVVLMFIINRNAVYALKLAEKKLNRAITIQNKVKIKYINIVNVIEFQYAKYGVQNSYEFANIYQMFLEDKKDRERYSKTTGRLGRATNQLTNLLSGIGVRDAEIWQGQLEALFNPKEMVEIRHSLNVQRQKLREQIEYNVGRVEEAKKNLTAFIKQNPQFNKEVLEVIDSYQLEV